VTADSRAGRQRSTRTGRRALVAAGAALTLLPLGAGTAHAQTFIGQPCVDPAPPAQFADRAQIAPVHLPSVDCAVAEGVVVGRGGSYFPAEAVPRDQLATMVVNTLRAGGFELPAPTDQGFTDIAGNVHRDSINVLAQIGS
jgi:capsular polysaccharide biosynthesis protein